MKTFNSKLLNQSLALVITLGGALYTSSVWASSFVHGGNARLIAKNNTPSKVVVRNNEKKQKKIYIDFNKKNQVNGKPSEFNEKIVEAESDLKNVGGTVRKKSVNSDSSAQASTLSPMPIDTTRSALKTEVKEQASDFGVALMIAKSREAELPESGQYSLNETTFIFLPSYKITDNYSTGLKFIGVQDSNDSAKSELKSGSLNLTKSAIDLNDSISASPALVYGFPVNSKQRNTDSFLGAAQANINFSTKKDVLGNLALSTIFGVTKSFYEYTTELNLDPEADDTYNSDYSTFEVFQAQHPIVGDLSFSFSLSNKQAWDYAGERKYSYDITETLNWQITKVFTLFGGLENEEAAKISESDLVYRFYNSETSTYVMGISLGI